MKYLIKSLVVLGLVLMISACTTSPKERSNIFDDYLEVTSEPNKYSQAMSIVPGLPVDVVVLDSSVEDYVIDIQAKEGSLLKDFNGTISTIEAYSGPYKNTTVYWSPRKAGDGDVTLEEDSIYIRLYDEAGFLVSSNTYQVVKDQEGFFALAHYMLTTQESIEPVEVFEDLTTVVEALENRVMVLEGDLETVSQEFDDVLAERNTLLDTVASSNMREMTLENNGYDLIYHYILTSDLSPEDILLIHLTAWESNNELLAKAALRSELRPTYDLLYPDTVTGLTLLEMNPVAIDPNNTRVQKLLASGTINLDQLQVVNVVYEADFPAGETFKRDGVYVLEYILGRRSEGEPYFVYDFGEDQLHEATGGLLDTYKEVLANESLSVDDLKDMIDMAPDYAALFQIYTSYEGQFTDVVKEKYSQKLYLLYNEDQLSGLFEHLSKLRVEQIDRHAQFLITQMHFTEGFEYITQIAEAAREAYPSEPSVITFVDALYWWMAELDQ